MPPDTKPESEQDWRRQSSVKLHWIAGFYLFFPFTWVWCHHVPPWSSNKAPLHTRVLGSCKAGSMGHLGSGNPPGAAGVGLLRHILLPSQPRSTTTMPHFILSATAFPSRGIVEQDNREPGSCCGVSVLPIENLRSTGDVTPLCSKHNPCGPNCRGQGCQSWSRLVGSHISWGSGAELTPGWQCTPEAEGYFPQMTSNPFAFPRVQLVLKSAGTKRSWLRALQAFRTQSYGSLTIPLLFSLSLSCSANTHPGNGYLDPYFPHTASHRG